MPATAPFSIQQLTSKDVTLMEAMLTMLGEAFDEKETYGKARPSRTYLARLLANDYFIVIAALKHGAVVGGIAAYDLPKFEQERSELYFYKESD